METWENSKKFRHWFHSERQCTAQNNLFQLRLKKEITTEIRFMSLSKCCVIFFTASFTCICSAQTFFCPEQIKTPNSLINNYPGWKIFTSSQQQYFEQISITSGSPEKEATLVPDVDTKRQVGWTILAGDESWLVCNYMSSNIRLAQRLPKGIKQCFVKLKPVGAKAVQQTNELMCK